MLIPTIQFEIRNFSDNSFEKFIVQDTELNYALIAANHFTRDIQFVNMFDFQYDREKKAPQFVEFADAFTHAVSENCGGALEIDPIDEMVGTF